MTIVNPVVTPTNLSGFPMGLHTYTNITPFTYRDGLTFLEKVEALQAWLRTILVPHIDGEISQFGIAWNAEVTALQDAVNAALQAQATEVNDALTETTTSANEAIATEKDYVDQNLTALHEYVDAQIQGIINNSVDANDSVIQTLVNNTQSLTRKALDALYLALTDYDNKTSHLLDTDTLTREAFDGRYFQSSGSTLDVPHGGTGRDTNGVANGVIVAGAAPTDPQKTVTPGTSGQFLVSSGAGAAPQFKTIIDDVNLDTAKVWSSDKAFKTNNTLPGQINLTGTYANRPVASNVYTGTMYYATDTQELYRATGVAGSAATGWAVYGPGGAEIGYAETTSITTFSAATAADVPGLGITIVHGTRPTLIEVEFIFSGQGGAGTTLGEIIASIYDVTAPASPVQLKEAHGYTNDGSAYSTLRFSKRVSGVAPGTVKTYSCKVVKGYNAASVRVMASATFPAYITARTL